MAITLATLPQATAQEVFDQVATHLLAQMKKSMNREKCLYRGPDGAKCAAGCLIADDEYNPHMEQSWRELVDSSAVPRTHHSLIASLQKVHDRYEPEEWHKKLKYYAVYYGLSAKVLEDFNHETK